MNLYRVIIHNDSWPAKGICKKIEFHDIRGDDHKLMRPGWEVTAGLLFAGCDAKVYIDFTKQEEVIS